MSKKEERNTTIEVQLPWYILRERVAHRTGWTKGGAIVKYLVGDARYKKGVSLRCLAQQARITRSYLQRIEAGEAKPSLEVMVRIANALESPLDALYREEECG